MELREALIMQAPSLALQRAAGDEIARLDGKIRDLTARYYEAMAVQAEMHRRLKAVNDLINQAMEYDNGRNDQERPPDGDAYNELWSYIAAAHLSLQGEGLTCETVPA